MLVRAAPWSTAALLAAVLAGAAGCESFEVAGTSRATLTYTEDARAAYQEALDAYRSKQWEDAHALFSEVKRLFPYSRYARLAELRLADIEFEQEKYTESVAAYREWISNHRTERDVEYAKFRIARALFLDVDDTVLLPPQEERDQTNVAEAYRDLNAFLRQFPETRYRSDAEYMLEVVTGRLVRHELYVARYYLKRDVFEAAVARIDYAVKRYPGSSLEPEALVLKGETLLKMKKRDEARAVFQLVIDRYGGPFATTAQSFLDEVGHEAKAKPAP
jgi:outer membrane protein assembly factor BamD